MLYLCVALTRDILGDYQAEAWDILPFYDVRVVANSEESYANAIAQLRRGLAWSRVGNQITAIAKLSEGGDTADERG